MAGLHLVQYVVLVYRTHVGRLAHTVEEMPLLEKVSVELRSRVESGTVCTLGCQKMCAFDDYFASRLEHSLTYHRLAGFGTSSRNVQFEMTWTIDFGYALDGDARAVVQIATWTPEEGVNVDIEAAKRCGVKVIKQ